MKYNEIINELKINNVNGVGSVPFNADVDYFGLRVQMRPSTFLRLALPLDPKNPNEARTIEWVKTQLDNPGLGAPFLTINIPRDWEEGTFQPPARVKDHDGRHRMYAIMQTEGDEPVEVHLLPGGGMRRRHITDAMINELRDGMLNQSGAWIAGPLFGDAQ